MSSPQQIEKKITKEKIKQIMYCICLQYGNEKPFLYNFEISRTDVLEDYKDAKLYKPEYTIIKVEINLL